MSDASARTKALEGALTADDMPDLADLIAAAFLAAERPETIGLRTTAMRQRSDRNGLAVP